MLRANIQWYRFRIGRGRPLACACTRACWTKDSACQIAYSTSEARLAFGFFGKTMRTERHLRDIISSICCFTLGWPHTDDGEIRGKKILEISPPLESPSLSIFLFAGAAFQGKDWSLHSGGGGSTWREGVATGENVAFAPFRLWKKSSGCEEIISTMYGWQN